MSNSMVLSTIWDHRSLTKVRPLMEECPPPTLMFYSSHKGHNKYCTQLFLMKLTAIHLYY